MIGMGMIGMAGGCHYTFGGFADAQLVHTPTLSLVRRGQGGLVGVVALIRRCLFHTPTLSLPLFKGEGTSS